MIIKGKSRAGPSALAAHLGNTATNERVSLIETRGTAAADLRGALIELDAYAAGTRCELPLYHANIDPGPPHRLSPEQRAEAIDALEEKLGLSGHQRVVVLHEKHGREHFHVVWTRIDTDHMRSVSDSHNYRKHEEVARDLERRFGHERVQGAHAERDGVERPDRTPSRAELRQEERTGIKGKDVKLEVTEAFRSSDGPEAFKAALEDKGYMLAQGDRRDFVIVDHAGGIHSLARRLDGVNAAELREFMKPMDRAQLPTASQAKDAQFDRDHGNASPLDQERWDAALAQSAIGKAKAEDRKQKKERAERRKDHKENLLEKAYASSDSYVTQAEAAQRDFEKRQEALNSQPRPDHPDQHRLKTVEGRFETQGVEATARADAPVSKEAADMAQGQVSDRLDHNKVASERHDRLDNAIYGDEGYENSELRRIALEKARQEQHVRDERLKAAPGDKPLGEITESFDHREFAERRYKDTDAILYGEDGYEKSEQARLASEQAKEVKGTKAATEAAKIARGHEKPDESRIEEIRTSSDDRKRSESQTKEQTPERARDADRGEKAGGGEITDRMRRLIDSAYDEERDLEHDDDLEPDRQREAPGGGRTRGR